MTRPNISSPTISRRRLLALAGAAAGLVAVNRGAATWEAITSAAGLLPFDQPGRDYPPYSNETNGGWAKYADNPVLGGSLGTCFDVCVLRDGDVFRMWFSWRPRGSIALVESRDGRHWSLPRIVLGPGPAAGWEAIVNRPSVIKVAGRYHMWYTGQTASESHIGYASSPDGIRWARAGSQPVLSADSSWEKSAVMAPSVMQDAESESFRMWYSGGDQFEPDAIGYATSPDGLRWSKELSNPVFRPGQPHAWDQDKVTAPQVLRVGEWYVMFYIGFFNEVSAQIGLARSRDGITAWQRNPHNPIVRPGLRPSEWDYSAAYRPWALRVHDGWMLWYNGRRGSLEQIGVVTHRGPDLGFD